MYWFPGGDSTVRKAEIGKDYEKRNWSGLSTLQQPTFGTQRRRWNPCGLGTGRCAGVLLIRKPLRAKNLLVLLASYFEVVCCFTHTFGLFFWAVQFLESQGFRGGEFRFRFERLGVDD